MVGERNPSRTSSPPPPDRRRSWAVLWTVLILLGLLAATAVVMAWAWSEIGEVEISRHGLISLGLVQRETARHVAGQRVVGARLVGHDVRLEALAE